MNVLNKSFIYFLISITSFHTTDGPSNTHLINNTYYSTTDCNQEFWEALLQLLHSTNTISIATFNDKYPDIQTEIQDLYKRICNDTVMHFYDINKFLFKLNSEDYTTLMSYLKADGLDTPSDWSSIGSSDEEFDKVVISLNINDYVRSPIHDEVSEDESDDDTEDTSHVLEKIDTMGAGAGEHVEQFLDKPREPSPIMVAPTAIRFYDPTNMPKKEFSAKPKTYCEYCNDPPQKHSWYIGILLKCNEWIRVPECLKKYF
jgi:hypothetical protein